MIRIMLIDDEKPAIDELIFFLKDYSMNEIRTYSNPALALKEIAEFHPHIIFVDIDMPQMSGLEFAEKIREFNDEISIIFVTAYSQYALEAYKVHPEDYFLKPINEVYFHKTMRRILQKLQASIDTEKKENNVRVQCFGKFEVYDGNGEQIKFATKKTRELFAYFLTKVDRVIYRDELLFQLFPGTNPEKALNNFYVSLHRLRKGLEQSNITKEDITITENGITYIREGVCPYVDLCRLVTKTKLQEEQWLSMVQSRLEEYSNDLFPNLDFEWLDEEKKWLEVQVEALLLKLSLIYEQGEDYTNSEQILLRLLDINPDSTEAHEALLNLYQLTNNKSSYRGLYKKYVRLMEAEYGGSIEMGYVEFYRKIIK